MGTAVTFVKQQLWFMKYLRLFEAQKPAMKVTVRAKKQAKKAHQCRYGHNYTSFVFKASLRHSYET